MTSSLASGGRKPPEVRKTCSKKTVVGGLTLRAGLLCLLFFSAGVNAKEIHSNGTGGGPWSEAATWRGSAIPGANDEVVISRGDAVVFDRNDNCVHLTETAANMVACTSLAEGFTPLAVTSVLLAGASERATCRTLSLDPKSQLSFKAGMGRATLCVAGPIEAYGAIKLDARNQPGDVLELRLIGKKVEERTLKLQKGGALVLHGRGGPERRSNVVLSSWPPARVKAPANDLEALGTVDAQPGSMVDVQRAEIANVQVGATNIDNTGTKPNERFQVVDSRFTGRARVALTGGDTPLIANNVFDYDGVPWVQPGAIYLNGVSLADVKGNSIRGYYYYGIQAYAMVDAAIADNSIDGCYQGIYFYGENGMVKQAVIRGCQTGVVFTSASGVMEDVAIDGAQTGYYHGGATMQATSLKVTNLQKGGDAIYYASGPLTLLNCAFRPEQIKIDKTVAKPPQPPPFLVQSMQFLVVGVKGEAPADAQVEVVTANPSKP